MSFDIYIQWFSDGESGWVPTEDVRRVFGSALVGEEDFGWRLSFGPNLDSDVHLFFHEGDPSRLSGVSVNRPCSVDAMWVALFDLLGFGNSVFYFPGGAMFVRSSSSARHVPPDMLEALGVPRVVFRPTDLVDAIKAS